MAGKSKDKEKKMGLGIVGLLLGGAAVAIIASKKASGEGTGSGGDKSGTVSIVVSRVNPNISPRLDAALPNDVTITVTGKAIEGAPPPNMLLGVEIAYGIGAYTTIDLGPPTGLTSLDQVVLNQNYSRTVFETIPALAGLVPGSNGYGTFHLRGYMQLHNQFGTVEYRTTPVDVTLGIAPSGTISPIGTV